MELKTSNLVFMDTEVDSTSVDINFRDRESVRKFLEDHEGLSSGEIAILCGRSNTTIRRWRRALKLPMKTNPFKRNYAKVKKVSLERITDQTIWDNRDWFHNAYYNNGHGIHQIAYIIGRTIETVLKRFRAYGVQTRKYSETIQSRNPCCSESWLYYHYASKQDYINWCKEHGIAPESTGGKELGLVACAKIAGVVPYTIMNWLIKFRMNTRDIGAAGVSAYKRLNNINERHIMAKAQGRIIPDSTQVTRIRPGEIHRI